MGTCVVCESHLGFFSGDEMRRCRNCIDLDKWPPGHQNFMKEAIHPHGTRGMNVRDVSAIADRPSLVFVNIARWIASLYLAFCILGAVGLFIAASDPEIKQFSYIMTISGCVSIAFGIIGFSFAFMVAEMSDNIARLFRPSTDLYFWSYVPS